jgi:adenosylcobinamide hydrolase
MIAGIHVDIDSDGVAVQAATPLVAVSSAVVGGGLAIVDAILNLRVPKGLDGPEAAASLAAFAQRRGVHGRYVGLLTAAATEKAARTVVRQGPLSALAIVTVGLSNPITAGVSPAAGMSTGTINAIVVVDADVEPAALVNAAMTVTEVKTRALIDAGVKGADGYYATGTSTDAVVVAATQRGPRRAFGGPISDLGWIVAQAADTTLRRGVARWLAEHA